LLTSEQDSEDPSVPQNLQALSVGNTSIELSWDASSDNIAVAYYEIYRADVKVGETVSLSFEDNGLEPATTYIYSVVAVDNYENRSDPSSSLPIITTDVYVDEEAPTVPSGLVADAVSTSQINLIWEPSTDNDAVKNYKVFRDDVEIAQTEDTTYEDKGLEAGTGYEYEVSAVDNSDNESALCTPVSATTLDLSVNMQSQKDDTQSEITCFPSPSNGVINIRFSVEKAENIDIVILNILGKVVRRVDIENPALGEHTVEFDISDQPRGLYIYQVRTFKGISAGKIELLD
jgi:chitodextrinase